MALSRISLTDFRCFSQVEVDIAIEGTTALTGPNGAGKSSVVEGVSWLADQRSFRGSQRDLLVRTGADQAMVIADLVVGGRKIGIRALLPRTRNATLEINSNRVRNTSSVSEVLRAVTFSPDDLRLVQGGPADRRSWLDGILSARSLRAAERIRTVERALRQRAALLKQIARRGGGISPEVGSTLDVWDERLAGCGSLLAEDREDLVGRLSPLVDASYRDLSGSSSEVSLLYRRSWEGDLQEALVRGRQDDVVRQATGVGPHRDELVVLLDGRTARSQASQGEQRCIALGLKVASHAVLSEPGREPPVLLLDDVFSELDHYRATALVAQLPRNQTILTTAGDLPAGMEIGKVVELTADHSLAAPGIL